jgi:hypothetical protein
MGAFMMVSMLTVKNKDLEFTPGQIKKNTLANGKMEIRME